MPTSLETIRDTAVQMAEDASKIPMSYFRAPLVIDSKADESPVTIADKETELFIRDVLISTFPDHGIFGEEYGITGSLDGETWIIDPIDGTRSFISGNPLFGMLLGYLSGGIPQMGLVRMPALNETFVGVPGQGATMNGTPIRCRATTSLKDAMIYVNESDRIRAAFPGVVEQVATLGQMCRHSYDCYPHAMVAAGNIDLVLDYDLQPYDYLPLVGLVQAAGGVITDWDGGALTPNSKGDVITAATPELHRQILETLKAYTS